jgi:HrpA-like RNA helicase
MTFIMPRVLPIESIKQQVLACIKHSDLIVSAETGSGKSTCLPIWAQRLGRVLVIEPRRIACLALAEYLAQLSNTKLGADIGYAIRFDTKFTADTNVVFVTPGVALRWLFENNLRDFNVVILDEFHERRWDTDLLLAILNKRKSHRLLLTSATLNSASLARYTGATEMTASGRSFPITIRHIATDMRQMPMSDNLELRIKQAVALALALSPADGGDILVFLPGKKEIIQAAQLLTSVAEWQDLLILPLHAGSDKQTQHRALNKQAQRRVILATNVAETSLTIPNISCVIDSGLERRTHLRGGRTVLSLAAIAQSSAEQRKGRAGRVMAGFCIRLFGEFAPLEQSTPAQILREDLTEMVLSSACAGENIQQLQFLDNLPLSSLSIALQNLQRMAAIDNNNLATAHGKRIYPLPLDSQLAHLIVSMPTPELKLAMIDLASALCVNQRLYQLPTSASDIEALSILLPAPCDGALLIACVRKQSCDQLASDDLVTLNHAAIAEARQYATQIRRAFEFPTLKNSPAYNRDDLCLSIARAQPTLCFVKREKKRGVLANGTIEVMPARESRIYDAPDNGSNQAALVLSTHAIPGRGIKQTKTMATCVLPMPLSVLNKLELGEISCAQPRLKAGKITVEQRRIYAGRTIDSQLSPPPIDQLISVLVQLIAENRLYKGLHARLTVDIAAYQLYLALEKIPAPSNKITDVVEFIAHELTSLGIESLNDLKLIDAEDIQFDGIPEWEKAEFVSRYPQQIKLPDLQMAVEYQVARKQIRLHYFNGQRKTEPKRWELPNFSGWKICYQRASKVVDIR